MQLSLLVCLIGSCCTDTTSACKVKHLSYTITMKIEVQAIYTNRENEKWEVGNITEHPFAPLAFVLAVRVSDGKLVSLLKARLTDVQAGVTGIAASSATNLA